jgi:two-component system response regulator
MAQRILLVEDRPQDVRLTRRAIQKAGYAVEMDVAENGQEALDRLRQVGDYAGAALPDLVLLDWMMPLVNGQEVLQEVRKDSFLRRLPIIVLTTSRSDVDVATAYHEGCNAYLHKPVDPKEFQQTIEALGLFWLQKAVLPPR